MNEQYTGKSYVRTLQNIAFMSQGLPVMAFIYVYLESSNQNLMVYIPEMYHTMFFTLLMIVCTMMIYWSYKNYQNLIHEALAEERFTERLKIYKKATTTRYIVYGISAALITIGMYLTSYQPFGALFGVMIVFLSWHNPNARRIVKELKLKGHEKEVILQGLEIPEDGSKKEF